MSQPHGPYGQQPYGNTGPYQQPGPPAPPPAAAGYQPQGYAPAWEQPPPAYPPPPPVVYVQAPTYPPPPTPHLLQVHQVGYSTTSPRWTPGQMMWVLLTFGLAYPFIALSKRSKSTITRHH